MVSLREALVGVLDHLDRHRPVVLDDERRTRVIATARELDGVIATLGTSASTPMIMVSTAMASSTS